MKVKSYKKIKVKSLLKLPLKILFISFLIFILFIGTFIGLFVTGFFSSLSEPAPEVLYLLHYFEINGLRTFQYNVKLILSESMNLPSNYIKGKLSSPEILYIDINFLDYKKLEHKREQALNSFSHIDNGILISTPDDYVPAKIRYKNKELNGELRLKGDNIDHFGGDKWSFRIKFKNDETLFGLKKFSIQDPKTRGSLNEWVFQKAIEREGLMSIRYDFIKVIINGENKGIYAIEEHFDKITIENNQKREGVILKFNEDYMWKKTLNRQNTFYDEQDFWDYQLDNQLDFFYSSDIVSFHSNERLLNDDYLLGQFNQARSLLELFRIGRLKTSDVFDTNKLVKYYAIKTVLGCNHATYWNNMRFYYNPITSKLEPIGYDGDCGFKYYEGIIDYPTEITKFDDLVLQDRSFYNKYLKELFKTTEKEYLDNLFLELNEDIEDRINILHKDKPLYIFNKKMFYDNQDKIKLENVFENE